MQTSNHNSHGVHWQVGHFLNENPEFEFDLAEFLFSYKVCDSLTKRMQEFIDDVSSPRTDWLAKQAISARLDAGGFASVPAYRAYRPHSSIEELPTISKADLRTSGERYLCAEFVNEMLWNKNTTGSSGAPIRIWYNADFYFELLILALRKILCRAKQEIPPEHRVFCISVSDNHDLPDSVFVDPTGATGISIQIIVDGSKPETLDRVFRLIDRCRPIVVSTKPSLLEVMASVWKARSPAPLHIISSGSALLPVLRERLANLISGQVINAYAMTEFGLVASECPFGELHLDTSSVYVEILDDNGNPLPRGTSGELVLSSHRNAAMPLLRYRTGDLGVLSVEPCECGNVGPRVAQLNGRKLQCFKLPYDKLFPPTCFNDLFSRFPELAEFQVTQLEIDAFEVKVDFHANWKPRRESIARLRQHFISAIPSRPSVRVIEFGFTRDCKFERYRSNL